MVENYIYKSAGHPQVFGHVSLFDTRLNGSQDMPASCDDPSPLPGKTGRAETLVRRKGHLHAAGRDTQRKVNCIPGNDIYWLVETARVSVHGSNWLRSSNIVNLPGQRYFTTGKLGTTASQKSTSTSQQKAQSTNTDKQNKGFRHKTARQMLSTTSHEKAQSCPLTQIGKTKKLCQKIASHFTIRVSYSHII